MDPVRIIYVAALLMAAESSRAQDRYEPTLREWSIKQSVERRTFADKEAHFSPNGEMVFFSYQWGELACDCNHSRLVVFDRAALQAALSGKTPVPKLTIDRSSKYHFGLNFWGAKWSPDSRFIEFLGMDDRGSRQLFVTDTANGTTGQITRWPLGVSLNYGRIGNIIWSQVKAPINGRVHPPVYPNHVLTSADYAYYDVPSYDVPHQWTFFVSVPDEAPMPLKYEAFVPLSPDSNRPTMVAALTAARDIPRTWKSYELLGEDLNNGEVIDKGDSDDLGTYVYTFSLIDPTTGTQIEPLDAPTGRATVMGRSADAVPPAALWSEDGSKVILVNTSLPLDGRHFERRTTAYVVVYNVADRSWTAIEPLEDALASGRRRKITAVRWLPGDSDIVVEHKIGDHQVAGSRYTWIDGKWLLKDAAVAATPAVGASNNAPDALQRPSASLKVALRESPTERPIMYVSQGGTESALTAPDPALDGVKIVYPHDFKWQTRDGRTLAGGLLMPTGKSNRLPLVVAAYEYDPKLFQPDGPAIGYAAQLLVKEGFAVLITTIPAVRDPKIGETVNEGRSFLSETEDAIAALAAEGKIDLSNVGLIGFSRAGFNVHFAITHPDRIKFKAAIVDDSYPGTYSYMLDGYAIGLPTGNPYDGPFWNNKSKWYENEPSFNVDKMITPTLFTFHNETSIPYTRALVGAFLATRRPATFVVYPNGSHGLEMPLEKEASVELTVDWMKYWLKHAVDADPAKELQYERWRKLERDWRAQQAWERSGNAVGTDPNQAKTSQAN